MNIKKNNLIDDIYTSYGPFVGKICENANTQLQQDNIIESITSSPIHNSNNISNHLSPMKPDNHNKITKSITTIKIGGDVNKQNTDISTKNNLINEESSSFFNYKISICNHKISIWILLLILLVVICIGYFIYKYWYLKNTSIITYKKTNSGEINKIDNDMNDASKYDSEYDMEDDVEDDSEDDVDNEDNQNNENNTLSNST